MARFNIAQAQQTVIGFYSPSRSYLWRSMPNHWAAGCATRSTGLTLTKMQLKRVLEALVADGRCSKSKAHGLLHYSLHAVGQQPAYATPATEADMYYLLSTQPLHRLLYIAQCVDQCDHTFKARAWTMVQRAIETAKQGA